MLCERCGVNKSEVHLVRIINGERHDEHICRECAKEMLPLDDAAKMLKMTFSLEGIMDVQEALRDLIFPAFPDLSSDSDNLLRCPHCGEPLPNDIFDDSGAVLDEREEKELFIPEFDFNTDELESLKREMELAVREERYERAAEVRDKIRALEKSGAQEKGA